MNGRAEVVRVKTFGRIAFQVNILNAETGLYRNSLSRRFETKKEALELIPNYGLTILKRKDYEKVSIVSGVNPYKCIDV